MVAWLSPFVTPVMDGAPGTSAGVTDAEVDAALVASLLFAVTVTE
jgi:hypothetical protein